MGCPGRCRPAPREGWSAEGGGNLRRRIITDRWGMTEVNDTTPIELAITALRLDAEDRAAVLTLPGVRTFGDLRVVLDRGDAPKELAVKLKKVLPK